MVENQEKNRLAAAYERLHKDYLYLQDAYDALEEKMQRENSALKKELQRIKMLHWRMQLENERCIAEIRYLKEELQQK